MKTTLDLDDELLAEAKAIAARRRTTLKAIIEHALRREIQPAEPKNPDPGKYEVGPFGILTSNEPAGRCGPSKFRTQSSTNTSRKMPE